MAFGPNSRSVWPKQSRCLAQTLPAFLSYAKKAHGITHYRVSIFRRHSVGVTPNFCLKHLLK